MSEENIEIVSRLVEEFLAVGPEVVIPDFAWDMSTFRGWPDQTEYRGAEGLTEFLNAWREPYDDWSMAVEQFIDAGGDRVLAELTQRGRMKGSDADVTLRYGVVYTVKGRNTVRAQCYASLDEARDAVRSPLPETS